MGLPLGRADADKLASWLEDKTGIDSKYFKTKVTNKFPGLTDLTGTVFHFYCEPTVIEDDMDLYGTLEDLQEGRTVLVSNSAPKDFDTSRYYQYLGSVSGTID